MYIDVPIVPSTVVPPSAAPRPWVQTPAIPAQTPKNSSELKILQTECLQNKEYLYNIYEISTEYLQNTEYLYFSLCFAIVVVN